MKADTREAEIQRHETWRGARGNGDRQFQDPRQRLSAFAHDHRAGHRLYARSTLRRTWNGQARGIGFYDQLSMALRSFQASEGK
jgi:hypothetical protein